MKNSPAMKFATTYYFTRPCSDQKQKTISNGKLQNNSHLSRGLRCMNFCHKLEKQLSPGDFLRIEENPLPAFTPSITELSHMHRLVTAVGNNGRGGYVPAGRRLRHTHTSNQVGVCCPSAAAHQKPLPTTRNLPTNQFWRAL